MGETLQELKRKLEKEKAKLESRQELRKIGNERKRIKQELFRLKHKNLVGLSETITQGAKKVGKFIMTPPKKTKLSKQDLKKVKLKKIKPVFPDEFIP